MIQTTQSSIARVYSDRKYECTGFMIHGSQNQVQRRVLDSKMLQPTLK